jgi:hypothetical protein
MANRRRTDTAMAKRRRTDVSKEIKEPEQDRK